MTNLSLPPAFERRLSPRQRRIALAALPWLPPAAFLGGFTIDALTLRRVDDVGDNLQLTLFLMGAALLLVLERRAWHGRSSPRLVREHRGVARLGLQFFFGGLFSAYFIFYSQSATLGPSVGFCLVLAALMLANEVLFTQLRPDLPQVCLWFFCALSYLLFAVPTWTGTLGPGTRVVAAALALGATILLVGLVHWGPIVAVAPPRGAVPSSPRVAMRHTMLVCFGLLLILTGLVRLGVVPPVPLALAEAGIYHHVERDGDQVRLTYEAPPKWAFWRGDDRVFSWQEGDRVHCFTAVFAPTGSGTQIVHVWERKDDDGNWLETDRIPFTMRGGRDGGWRSWTAKQNTSPGLWRVRVVSEHGHRLGRVAFEIVAEERPESARRQRSY